MSARATMCGSVVTNLHTIPHPRCLKITSISAKKSFAKQILVQREDWYIVAGFKYNILEPPEQSPQPPCLLHVLPSYCHTHRSVASLSAHLVNRTKVHFCISIAVLFRFTRSNTPFLAFG